MARFQSIISRIIGLHIIAIGATSILMPAALYWLLSEATNSLHGRAMHEQADSIAYHLAVQPDGRLTLDLPPGLRSFYSAAYGRYAYAILDNSGQVLFSNLKDSQPVFPADPRALESAILNAKQHSTMMSGASVRKQIGDATVWIQVGENLAHKDVIIDDVVADFFKRVGWITLPILLALLAIDILIFRRALRPLRQASQIAETISPNRTDIRLPVDEIPTEIRPLVLAVNQALDRLEQGFQIQREFTADAAHELRTPLAILRARVETLANQQVTTALHQDIEGMSRIVTQLLDIAELETFAIDPAERVDLRTVCTEVAASIAPLAVAQGKSICLSADDRSVWVRGSSEMLFRAIRNVAENAVSHTPKGETAEIVLTKDGTVSVLDSGPGISEDERDLLFRRFWRRDRRRAGGAGLGLSIVQRIAQAHGATLTVENRPTGGANFSVCFPAVEGDDDVSIDHKSAPLVPHPDRHVREDVQEVIRGLGEQRSS